MAAAPQTVVGGVYADLFGDMRTRGRAMALYMAVCFFIHIQIYLCDSNSNSNYTGFKFWANYWTYYFWLLSQVWLAMDFPY